MSEKLDTLHWQVQRFRDLNTDELFDLMQFRVNTFIVEQRCPYPELEEEDRHPETLHLSARTDQGRLMAYARILPPGLRYAEVGLGRLTVAPTVRRQGIGHQLVGAALETIHSHWPGQPVRISAQAYLQAFYEAYGFAQASEVYLEDGIPHVRMVRIPTMRH